MFFPKRQKTGRKLVKAFTKYKNTGLSRFLFGIFFLLLFSPQQGAVSFESLSFGLGFEKDFMNKYR